MSRNFLIILMMVVVVVGATGAININSTTGNASDVFMSECVGRNDVNMFTDNFEVPSAWTLFEELVTSCYGEGIGTLDVSNPDAGFEGSYGAMLHSNKNKSAFSNHLIAGRNVSNGAYNRVIKYDLHAMLPTAYDLTSQVGPEFSVQNTRNGPGDGTTTTIAGMQHIASRYISDKWNIWVESEPGVATWSVLPESVWHAGAGVPSITAGVWWRYSLLVDFETNEYVSMTAQQAAYIYDSDTGRHPLYTANLTGLRMALEPRGFETATVITLEAENMYNNCGALSDSDDFTAFESQMYYDRVRYEEMPPRGSQDDDAPAACTPGTFKLEFEHEFDRHHPSGEYTAENVANWDFNLFQGNFGSSSNAYFEKRNVDVDDGQLVLHVTERDGNSSSQSSRPYIVAGIASWEAHAQVYGRWEVEAKMPVGYGITGYIGLFTTLKTWPPEVDFAETIGRQGGSLFMTQHYTGITENGDGGHLMNGKTLDAREGSHWSDGYHVYALEWTPDVLVYFVDGKEVLRQPVHFNETAGAGYIGAMDISVGLATGDCGGFVGCPEDASEHGFEDPLPATMHINYVRVFSYEPLSAVYEYDVPEEYISPFFRRGYRWKDDSDGGGPYSLAAPPECCNRTGSSSTIDSSSDEGSAVEVYGEDYPDYCHCYGWCSCYSV